MKIKGMQDFSEQFTEHFNHHSNSKQLEKGQLTYLLDEICDTVNDEVSVSYINHFNVQNMRQTIKLTPLFCNLVLSLLYIRILSIHFFSKFPKNLLFIKIKETSLFRSVEYNIYFGNDSFKSVKKRFLSEGESMMFEQYYHDCENM